MSYPPSYKTTSSETDPTAVTSHLTVDEKGDLTSRSSISSVASDHDTTLKSGFNVDKTLVIHMGDMAPLPNLAPSSSTELETLVTDRNGALVYTSTRLTPKSSDAVLSAPAAGDLVATHYHTASVRPPTLQPLQSTDAGHITVSGKWTSKALSFRASASASKWSWRYRYEDAFDGVPGDAGLQDGLVLDALESKRASVDEKHLGKKSKKRKQLVLEVAGHSKEEATIRLAQLLRLPNQKTKIAGINDDNTAIGGYLFIDQAAARTAGISEQLIVSTCIMMLKRESDRRRANEVMGTATGHILNAFTGNNPVPL